MMVSALYADLVARSTTIPLYFWEWLCTIQLDSPVVVVVIGSLPEHQKHQC